MERMLEFIADECRKSSDKSTEGLYDTVDGAMMGFGYAKAESRKPLINDMEYKLYHLSTPTGFVDWITVLRDEKYYSINLRFTVSIEDAIVINNSEAEMIQEFMDIYNNDKRACILTINNEYKAIDTKLTVDCGQLYESASDVVFKPLFTESRGDLFLSKLDHIDTISENDPNLLYELFEIIEEFRSEIKYMILEGIALRKNDEFRKIYLKQAESYLLEHGIDVPAHYLLELYKRFLKYTNC